MKNLMSLFILLMVFSVFSPPNQAQTYSDQQENVSFFVPVEVSQSASILNQSCDLPPGWNSVTTQQRYEAAMINYMPSPGASPTIIYANDVGCRSSGGSYIYAGILIPKSTPSPAAMTYTSNTVYLNTPAFVMRN